MRSVREHLLKQFVAPARGRAPEGDLPDALYALLRTLDPNADGWAYCRVVRESDDSLQAVGLMKLLPTGSIPIEISVSRQEAALAWAVRTGDPDPAWLALSESKRWDRVYLYATTENTPPSWEWRRRHHGSVPRADA